MQEVIGSTPIFSTEDVNKTKSPISFLIGLFVLTLAMLLPIDERLEACPSLGTAGTRLYSALDY